ncbi:MAG TPA: metal-dependent hydrolase [Pseudomonadales bacterium]
MDPITQATLGSALAQTAADGRRLRGFALAGAVSGLAPDADVLIRSATDPLLYLEFHRQFSHSLIFIPVGAGLCALLLHPLLRRWLRLRETALACLLGYGSHGLLDACTSYGTQLFWPFSDYRVAWNWISVVDPLFTLPLLVLAVLGARQRGRRFALAGLAWAAVYLGFGALQQERATVIARALATDRGHESTRLVVKPGFANLLVWKALYEADGYHHVDGIRAGLEAGVCEGDRVEALDPARDLTWLDPDSQQARDLNRFAWYSDGWLALDPEKPFYVVDVRYAALPNAIDALWGLVFDPQADARAHATWRIVPSRRAEDLDQLLNLLAGQGCRAL